MTTDQIHKANVIFNKHSFESFRAISPSKDFCLKAMEEFAIQFAKDFTEWRDEHSWEHDYREQHTHTLDEQIEIFTK